MAVPKRKVSKARRDKRRSSVWKLQLPGMTKCPKCGAELTQRKDDAPESVQNRLDDYEKRSVIAKTAFLLKTHTVEAKTPFFNPFCAPPPPWAVKDAPDRTLRPSGRRTGAEKAESGKGAADVENPSPPPARRASNCGVIQIFKLIYLVRRYRKH